MSVTGDDVEKQLRKLRKKLERSEADRVELEVTKEKNDALLRKVIVELRESQADLQAKREELQQALTDLQAAQEELIQSEKMAALGQLVAGVAHEINTPLGIGVTAASHLESRSRDLLRELEQDQLTRNGLIQYAQSTGEAADMILRNLRRASDLIQNFKQIAVDRSFEGPRRFQVGEYLDSVLNSISAALKKTAISVEVEGPDGLEIDSDPGLFSQVITNLVMNSLTHAFEPGQAGRVRICFEAQDHHLLLCYEDDGAGIAPQHIRHIFEPFFTTRRGSGGSGLGLNIVYNIVVDKLKGQIGCDSSPGNGCRFNLRLPGIRQRREDAA